MTATQMRNIAEEASVSANMAELFSEMAHLSAKLAKRCSELAESKANLMSMLELECMGFDPTEKLSPFDDDDYLDLDELMKF